MLPTAARGAPLRQQAVRHAILPQGAAGVDEWPGRARWVVEERGLTERCFSRLLRRAPLRQRACASGRCVTLVPRVGVRGVFEWPGQSAAWVLSVARAQSCEGVQRFRGERKAWANMAQREPRFLAQGDSVMGEESFVPTTFNGETPPPHFRAAVGLAIERGRASPPFSPPTVRQST